jgi:hypothetical protein
MTQSGDNTPLYMIHGAWKEPELSVGWREGEGTLWSVHCRTMGSENGTEGGRENTNVSTLDPGGWHTYLTLIYQGSLSKGQCHIPTHPNPQQMFHTPAVITYHTLSPHKISHGIFNHLQVKPTIKYRFHMVTKLSSYTLHIFMVY